MTEVDSIVPIASGLFDKGLEDVPVEGVPSKITDISLLTPDHPLMSKFQQTLKTFYSKQSQKLDQYIAEMKQDITYAINDNKEVSKRNNHLETELRNEQASLSRLNEGNARVNDNIAEIKDVLEETNKKFQSLSKRFQKEKEKEDALNEKRVSLANDTILVTKISKIAQNEALTVRGVKERLSKEKRDLTSESLYQDLFINRLTENIYIQQDKIELNKAQCLAQKEELSDLKQKIITSNAELEVIKCEKEQIFVIWENWIRNLADRSLVAKEVEGILVKVKSNLAKLKTELANTNKVSIKLEQEKNEKLTLKYQQVSKDVANLIQNRNRLEELRTKFRHDINFINDSLNATKCTLDLINREKMSKEFKLEELNHGEHKLISVRGDLEQQMNHELRGKALSKKSKQHYQSLMIKINEQIMKMELQFSKHENEMAKLTVDTENIRQRVREYNSILHDELKPILENKNKSLFKMESDEKKFNILGEKKQALISNMTFKIEALITSIGGIEVGLFERQIGNLKREIEKAEEMNYQLSLNWLRQQELLIAFNKEHVESARASEMFHKKIRVYQEKQRLADEEIKKTAESVSERQIETENMRYDVDRLTVILDKENHLQDSLKFDVEHLYGEVMGQIKEAQSICIEKETTSDMKKRLNKELLDSMIDSETQLSVWNRNFKKLKETRQAIEDLERKDGLIQQFKLELQKQKVLYSNLGKDQQLVIKDQEKKVLNYANISIRLELDRYRNKGNRDMFNRKKLDIRRKISDLKKEVKKSDVKLDIMIVQRDSAKQEFEWTLDTCLDLRSKIHFLNDEILLNKRLKFKNLVLLDLKQKAFKFQEQIRNNLYRIGAKDVELIMMQFYANAEKLHLMKMITQDLLAFLPNYNEQFLYVFDCIMCVEYLDDVIHYEYASIAAEYTSSDF